MTPERISHMQKKYLFLLATLSLAYTLLIFITPISPDALDKYNLTLTQAKALSTLIAVPLIAIWTVAFYGSSVFDSYATLIKRDKDGAAFKSIVTGLIILVVGSATVIVVGSLLNYFSSQNLQIVKVQVVAGNYLTMAVVVSSIYFMYKGTKRLRAMVKAKQKKEMNIPVIFTIGYMAFAVLYTYMFLHNLPAATNIPLTTTSHAAYYTPTVILIPTLLVPYIISWYLGAVAIYQLWFYTQNIGGKIYASALRYLSYGLTAVIIGSIVMQVVTVFSGQVQSLSTTAILILIYGLLIIISAGYIPVAMGAKRLAAIEKI